MPARLFLSCDGCHTETKSEKFLARRFIGVTGRSYGFGRWEHDTPQDIAPEGWIVSDDATGCTYCPECWAEILAEVAAE